ncbi:MAG: translation elongation factor Ts [Bacteroidetes bacterium]|nr:translation elongation factor Ts [Rhodothermia bacterium]MCS7155993.1 translation elongation factor Ts [Bacteroidota bacterium]MCX7907681.1 translation elongation factor Ts [Bacteroidota bacterium]MDW8137810.1 translation elongation factor Ts [Bacteroidota bacterium]MDW8286339.1 translation elongation factor Ts [Bacteroidota bacterium]
MITAADVKRLRDLTGAGMMDCKQALEEAGGDIQKAIEILRKKGQKVAAKRAERVASEGVVVARVSPDGKRGVLVEVNCETDFVARSEDFVCFADRVAELALAHAPADLEALQALSYGEGRTVAEALHELVGKIGEKIEIARFTVLQAQGVLVAYVHPGNKLAVLVDIEASGELLQSLGRDMAMQVAAMNPVALDRESVPAEIRERELEIAREQARAEGKPEAIVERIAQGKLEKFYKEHVLLEQPFIKDGEKTVSEVLRAHTGARLFRFVRYMLGERQLG